MKPVATYLAAFEAAGIQMASPPSDSSIRPPDFTFGDDPASANNPDILCLDTCYADYVQPLCEQAFQRGYKGQIISCTLDFYQRVVERTSKEFMEGVIFQFPISTIRLNDPRINFRKPNGFYAEYVKRYGVTNGRRCRGNTPRSSSICGRDAAQRAGSIEPDAVLAAMKGWRHRQFYAFGEARAGGSRSCSASTTRSSATGRSRGDPRRQGDDPPKSVRYRTGGTRTANCCSSTCRSRPVIGTSRTTRC